MPTYNEVLTQVENLTRVDKIRLLKDLNNLLNFGGKLDGDNQIIPPDEIAETAADLPDNLAEQSSGMAYQELKSKIDRLSPERLLVAADFLAYLAERESNDATEELLKIPGFLEVFNQAKKNVAAGKVTTVDQLKRSY
ncbi:hypothetical protein [Planktothricoides sp. SR001]|uniref:hypothetical protein n=1 Tax=Planktothricoides sp. SR001 TaxID=1705388 RepID=UPI000A980DCB|nr:hypothetical protein [Planktothricoides sp. SR001]